MSTATETPVDLAPERDDRRDYLWAGEIVRVMPPDVPHANVVYLLAELLRAIFAAGETMVWTEQRLLLREGEYEPQPDVMVIRGTVETRGRRPPAPEDVLFLAEVADSSLAIDVYKKPPLYAVAGIAPDWVADVRGQRIIAFSEPDPASGKYGKVETFGRGERVGVGTGSIAVDDVFGWMDRG